MAARRGQRLAGLIIAFVSACLIGWDWYLALTRRSFYVKASMLFPAFLVLGVGMMLFPGYREERLARGEDISRLQGWRLITVRWWVVIGVALALGAVNYALLRWL
jgi:hypothetical protein